MSVRDRVLSILREPVVQGIHFNYGRVRLQASSFDLVASDIRSGRIAVQTGATLPSGARARYLREPPTLAFVSDVTESTLSTASYEKALVVHEAVHAFIHRQYRDRVRQINDEVNAYLAHTIYRMANERTFAAWADAARTYRDDAAIFYEAVQVINQHDLLTQFAALSSDHVQGLASAIGKHELYSSAS